MHLWRSVWKRFATVIERHHAVPQPLMFWNSALLFITSISTWRPTERRNIGTNAIATRSVSKSNKALSLLLTCLSSSTCRAPVEWYRSYGHVRHLMNPIYFCTSGESKFIKQDTRLDAAMTFPERQQAKVLILGCGNSSFGADMLKDGWGQTIFNVDFSKTVIDQMKSKYNDFFYSHIKSHHGRLEFIHADVTKPLEDFPDNSIDLIVCKGTLDCILCSETPKHSALSMIKECNRLLVPGHGIFFLISNGSPDNRIEYLEVENSLNAYWSGISVHCLAQENSPVGDKKQVFCYICRKKPEEGKENYYHHLT